jgi:Helicase associated domain
MFTALKAYRDKYGDCNVPRDWKENPKLARWVDTQRQLQRQGRLASERKARLDALGFDWNPQANKRRVSPLAAE